MTPQYATRWREIGIQLNLTSETISIIQEDNPGSAKKCCNVMLMKWLEVTTDASWQKLFTAIDNCTSTEQCNNQDIPLDDLACTCEW